MIKVRIKNFQAIQDAQIEIHGVTSLIGSTNEGKSAILRAIEAALYSASGDAFIRQGSQRTGVQIDLESPHNPAKVVWLKNEAEAAEYFINGQHHTKTGRKGPREFLSEVGFKEYDIKGDKIRLNFWRQMEAPFLIFMSPVKAFEVLSILDSHNINPILRRIIVDAKQARRDEDFHLGSLTVINEEISTAEMQRVFCESLREATAAEVAEMAIDIAKYEGLARENGALSHVSQQIIAVQNSLSSLLQANFEVTPIQAAVGRYFDLTEIKLETDRITREVSPLKWIDVISEGQLNNMLSEAKSCLDDLGLLDTLHLLDSDTKRIARDSAELEWVHTVTEEQLEEVTGAANGCLEVLDTLGMLQGLDTAMQRITSEMEAMSWGDVVTKEHLDEIGGDATGIQSALNHLEVLDEMSRQLSQIAGEIQESGRQESALRVELGVLENEEQELKQQLGVCPICGTEWTC